jgi:flagellar hook protein FlgE
MGYPAVNGVVNSNAALTPVNIPVIGQVIKPQATSSFSMNATLDSQTAINSTVTGQVQVFDSLGKSYEASVTYTKQDATHWGYTVSLPDTLSPQTNTSALGVTSTVYGFGTSGGGTASVDPGTDLTITGQTAGGTTATIVAPPVGAGETLATYATDLTSALTAAGITGVTASGAGSKLTITGTGFSTSGSVIQEPIASASAKGQLVFDASGNLVSPAADISGITFTGLSDGAAPMNMTWNILGSSGAPVINQADAQSATSSTVQDGFGSGTYQSFSIGPDGTVTASYSNGHSQALGQLALANVTNLQGLALQGNGNYAITSESGAASIGVSGTNGLGVIQGSALEQSNVNISAEFSNLIIAQRAFEANAKSVTTFDTVAQDTINMVH